MCIIDGKRILKKCIDVCDKYYATWRGLHQDHDLILYMLNVH